MWREQEGKREDEEGLESREFHVLPRIPLERKRIVFTPSHPLKPKQQEERSTGRCGIIASLSWETGKKEERKEERKRRGQSCSFGISLPFFCS